MQPCYGACCKGVREDGVPVGPCYECYEPGAGTEDGGQGSDEKQAGARPGRPPATPIGLNSQGRAAAVSPLSPGSEGRNNNNNNSNGNNSNQGGTAGSGVNGAGGPRPGVGSAAAGIGNGGGPGAAAGSAGDGGAGGSGGQGSAAGSPSKPQQMQLGGADDLGGVSIALDLGNARWVTRSPV